MASPFIGLAGAIGSSLISNIGAQKREKEAQKQNVEFWKMQNMYNLPTAQMQRLKDAGLNPNLIYGSSPAAASGSAGSISPAKAAPYNISDPTQSIATTTLLDAQKRNVNANTTKTEEDAANTRLQTWILEKAKDSQVAIQLHRAAQEQQKVMQEQYKTLELGASFQKRVDILSELVKQHKSITALKQLDEMFAKEANLRPNDPFYARGLKSLWDMATNFKDPNWLSKQAYDYFKKGETIKKNKTPDSN